MGRLLCDFLDGRNDDGWLLKVNGVAGIDVNVPAVRCAGRQLLMCGKHLFVGRAPGRPPGPVDSRARNPGASAFLLSGKKVQPCH